MLIKAGVDISRLKRDIRRALTIIGHIYVLQGDEVVITSTYEGNHKEGSLHYADNAFDFRRSKVNPTDTVANIKFSVGKDYDVILCRNHVHIEYDPK